MCLSVTRNVEFCGVRRAVFCGIAICWLASGWAFGGAHPRLLIGADDVPRLRAVCGVAGAEGAGRAATHASEYQALRGHFVKRPTDELLAGELSGAAFLHVIEPADPLDRQRLKLVEDSLRQPASTLASSLEAVLALDWCWADLPADARRAFALNLVKAAGPFTAADSPLDHRVFREKLAALAVAAIVDEEDEASASWGQARRTILQAARDYFRGTFPVFLEWRGLAPTSPTAGPAEESDAALAVEIAGLALGEDAWHTFGPRVGRWMEHYVYASFANPALQHAFIRDDGTDAPLSPAPNWDELQPLTAHLIAMRTDDAAAGFIARRVDQRLRGAATEALALPWHWVPIVFELTDVPRCDFSRLPLARNLGGAVAFRSTRGAVETGIWIEAGQPVLRRGQHFDAGHFLIYSGGHLTVSGGDDVCLEAVPAKKGEQRLGRDPRPFDYEQYFAAAISHNCLLLRAPLRAERWYGQNFQPLAGQRLIEGTCTNFAAALEGSPRQTGRQLAYGQDAGAAYVALDLLPAYDAHLASAYTREFLFLDGRALLVIDRVEGATESDPTWVVNLPSRPTVDGADLTAGMRSAGDDNDAGIWRADDAGWVRWQDGDGVAFMTSLMPKARRVFIAGGPAKRLTIPQGMYTGRGYYGGEAAGFEDLVRPADDRKPQNAWYRLGQPTVLGAGFGQQAHWGRVEIAPAERAGKCLFVTLFIVDAGREQGPAVSSEVEDGELRIKFGDVSDATVALRVDGPTGATVTRAGGGIWESPHSVESDSSLAEE